MAFDVDAYDAPAGGGGGSPNCGIAPRVGNAECAGGSGAMGRWTFESASKSASGWGSGGTTRPRRRKLILNGPSSPSPRKRLTRNLGRLFPEDAKRVAEERDPAVEERVSFRRVIEDDSLVDLTRGKGVHSPFVEVVRGCR
jgi:hypothetical protein